MAWAQHDGGLFKRPIGDNERFIKLIGDRGHAAGLERWAVTVKASFALSEPLEEQNLIKHCRDAWISLRFEHPSIAAVAEENHLTYSVGDLHVWAKESFFTHPADVTSGDVIANLKPSRYTTAHLLLNEPAIILRFAHWRTDAYGAFHLLDAYLNHLSTAIATGDTPPIPWGEERTRLVPSVEEVLRLPLEPTPEIQKWTTHYLSKAALLQNCVGLDTPLDPKLTPGGTRSSCLRLTPSETTAILAAAGARDLSLPAAVHASCAAATYLGAPPAHASRPYASTMRFPLRPHLPSPSSGRAHAAGLFTGGYVFAVPADATWAERAAAFENEYRTGVTSGFLACRRQYARQVFAALTAPPSSSSRAGPLPAANSEIDISGVDGVDDLVAASRGDGGRGRVEVRDVSVGVATLTRQMYCFHWVFRGRLGLSVVYNEAFYGAARVDRIVRELRRILLSELSCVE